MHPRTGSRLSPKCELEISGHAADTDGALFRPVKRPEARLEKFLTSDSVYRNVVMKYAKELGISVEGFGPHALRSTVHFFSSSVATNGSDGFSGFAGIGLLSIGGLAVGGLALGGGAIGLIACGGGAVGLIAWGGGSLGYVAIGGGAVGVYVLAGDGAGRYVLSRSRQDREAIDLFCRYLPRLRTSFSEEPRTGTR
ncbi:MAG: hypothetical protein AB9869_25080 [Verrucomicrobiia bacterium]